MTQTEVAKKLQINESTVSKWETGESKPRVEKLLELAHIFGCTVDELLREDLKMPKVKSNRITPELVGSHLGLSAQSVRELMDTGNLKIGFVSNTAQGQKQYIILPKMLYEATGIKLNGYEPLPNVNIDYEELAKAIVCSFMGIITGGGGEG